MNRIQKRVFLITLGLLIFMAICPPWHITTKGASINLGYWWIVDPPSRSVGADFARHVVYGKINLLTLTVQWITVIVGGAGLMYYFKDEPQTAKGD